MSAPYKANQGLNSSMLLMLATLHENTHVWRQYQSDTSLSAKARPVGWSSHYIKATLRHSSVLLCAVLSLLDPEMPLLGCHKPLSQGKLLLSLWLQRSPKISDEVQGTSRRTRLKHAACSSPVCHIPISSWVHSFLSEQVSLIHINSFLQRLATCSSNFSKYILNHQNSNHRPSLRLLLLG